MTITRLIMNTYVVFSRAEVLNEEIGHIGQKVEAPNLSEASAKVKKWIKFDLIKEYLIVCYEDWNRDPDFGKLNLSPKGSFTRKINVRMKQDGYFYEGPLGYSKNLYSDS